MDLDRLIDEARDELTGARECVELAVSRALHILGRVEEEQRRLRREAMQQELKVYTEAEAAKLLKLGHTTLRELRASRGLPHCRAGDRVIYTAEQLERITRMLERPVTLKEVKRA